MKPKSKIIGLVLLASLSAPAFAGDFESVLGGVIIGTVIGNQITEVNRSPYYYPPQVIYAPPPQVLYAPPPVIYSQPQIIYRQAPYYYGGYEQHQRRWNHHDHDRNDNHRRW